MTGSRLLCFALTAFGISCQAEGESPELVEQTQQALGVCREVELESSRSYAPAAWVTDFERLTPRMRFALPSEIPVTSGNSGHGQATLRYRLNGVLTKCVYVGNNGSKYVFDHCTNGATPGTVVKAGRVRLRVNSGKHSAGTTVARLVLDEVTPCRGGEGGSGGSGAGGGSGGSGGDGGSGGGDLCGEGVVIDDSNPCTADACDPETGPVHDPLPTGSSCADATVCNGAETCDASAVCQPGTPLVVNDDGNGCTLDACDPVLGVVHTPQVGLSCSDGEPCNGAETCDAAGQCVAGAPLDVDDGDACTIDTCVEGVGAVHHACSPLDPAVTTTVADSLGFLIEGPNPVQVGVAPGAIDFALAGALQGHVTLPDGSPAMGAWVRVVGEPEYGVTTTDAAGHWIMLVNASERMTVAIEAEGYLPTQRDIESAVQGYRAAADVQLVALDELVTPIDLEAQVDVEVAEGSVSSDSDGDRQGVAMIAPGTEATLVMPNGAEMPVTALSIRITEYTVGPDGPARMPAELPPTTQYTYAFEIGADEAIAAGAASVKFNQPVNYFVENFLGAPVGTPVPHGSYDRAKAQWLPEPDARVIAIVGESGGEAEVDVDGDGLGDSSVELDAVGLDFDTRVQLAERYVVGAELWFAPLTHFSPHDWNFGVAPEEACEPCACGSSDDCLVSNHTPDDPVECAGSIIECQTQTLRETIPLEGTGHSLSYASDRVPGRIAARRVTLPMAGSTLPPTLRRIEAILTVAGKTYETTQECPCEDASWEVTWDGRDRFGRLVQGQQPATYELRYVYDAVLRTSPEWGVSWAKWNQVPVAAGVANGPRSEATLPRIWNLQLGAWDARAQGLGGLTLDAVHGIDLYNGTLMRGDGRRENNDPLIPTISTAYAGGLATRGKIIGLRDGGVAWLTSADRIIKRAPDGTLSVLGGPPLGGGACVVGVDRPALGACLGYLDDFAEGADGSLYFSSLTQVSRIRPDGWLELVAGTGASGFSGDGGPAIDANMDVRSVAVAPDGALYIGTRTRIRRVGLDGVIETVLGNGAFNTSTGDGGFASGATCADTLSMVFGADGALYFTDFYPHSGGSYRIRRIDRGGTVTHFAGTHGVSNASSNAVDALSWSLVSDGQLTAMPDGGLLVSTSARIVNFPANAALLRRVSPDGRALTIAGRNDVYNSNFVGEDEPAARSTIGGGSSAVASDGTIFYSMQGRVLEIRPTTPSLDVGSFLVASKGEREVYTFDAAGRHRQTRDAQRGTVTATIAYDAGGLLESITDEHGLTTTIERDVLGAPTAIEGPYGHRTTLTLNADGWLETITDPTNQSTDLAWEGNGGLLAGFSTRNGNQTTFDWDADGRLIGHVNAAGGGKTIERTETDDGYEVTVTSPLGRTSMFSVETTNTNADSRVNTGPSGLSSTRLRTTGDTYTSVSADGTQTTTQMGPDPRFGMRASFATSSSTRLPSGLTRVTQSARTATLSNPNDPLSLTAWTETTIVNGRTSTTSYNLGTRVQTSISPAGRITASLFDAQGKVLQIDPPEPSDESIFFAYDTNGRLLNTTQGTRVTGRTYGTDGMLATMTNPLLQTTAFGRNARGDVLTETRPDLEVTSFAYDGEGQTTSVTPPGQPAHTMAFNEIEELEAYTPPSLGSPGATTYDYNLDKQLAFMTQPGPRLVEYGYDSAGRLDEVIFPGGAITRGYSPSTGRVVSVGGPSGVSMSMTYDGSLLKSTTFSGAVAGTIAWTHDTDFRVVNETVNGAWAAAFAFDPDSLLTSAAGLTLARDAQSGRVTSATSGSVVESYTHNEYGEVATRTSSFGGSPFLEISYERDDLGRITAKTETVGGVTTVYAYGYDDVGRLLTVTEDGDLVESYAYDPNGNRTSSTNASGTFGATYDEQDRIVGYGANLEYEFTDNGELLSRTDTATNDVTEYEYDAVGNLRGVVLPNGDEIEYLVDGQGRRVGKTVNGVFEKGWLWRGQLQPVAELDASGNVVARFVYGARNNVPELMVTSAATYRLVKDHLGSVRFVIDASTGAVVQELAYDAWGRVMLDTNPGFQPFGFAGGLYEPDTGLVRFGVRDYDAEIGRWTAKDPARFIDGPNIYSYAGSDPINHVDRTGLDWLDDAASILAPGVCLLVGCGGEPPNGPDFDGPSGRRWERDQGTDGFGCQRGDYCSAPPPDVVPCMEEGDEDERCKKVKDQCIAECTSTLPTPDFGFKFWNCVNACMEAEGCR